MPSPVKVQIPIRIQKKRHESWIAWIEIFLKTKEASREASLIQLTLLYKPIINKVVVALCVQMLWGTFGYNNSLTVSKFRKYVEKSKEKTQIVCAHTIIVYANSRILAKNGFQRPNVIPNEYEEYPH